MKAPSEVKQKVRWEKTLAFPVGTGNSEGEAEGKRATGTGMSACPVIGQRLSDELN